MSARLIWLDVVMCAGENDKNWQIIIGPNFILICRQKSYRALSSR